ncbi:MAG: hypothetical protein N2379_08775, partial [Verrucomicrobiae bacterium]|nr:hypothetical protein [Verrucomicrobiae bacterium]
YNSARGVRGLTEVMMAMGAGRRDDDLARADVNWDEPTRPGNPDCGENVCGVYVSTGVGL